MKKILILAAMACMASCQNTTTKTPAIDTTNLDLTVAPNADFYQYATGGWQAKNPLKPEYSRYGSFDVLRENNEKRINALFSEMTRMETAAGSVEQKIADLYKMGLDSVRLNAEGAAPIKARVGGGGSHPPGRRPPLRRVSRQRQKGNEKPGPTLYGCTCKMKVDTHKKYGYLLFSW